jgi:SSS family solute:Na+ symporter
VSVGLWVVFDFLTVSSGLAARVLLPDLADPLAAYPALAAEVLPPLLRPLFTLGLVATVMSTLDSYLFLAAATFSHDLFPSSDPLRERRMTRWGLAVSAALAAIGALVFDSVVTVWHHVGSVVTSALLVPVVTVHLPHALRPRPLAAGVALVSAAVTSAGWILAARDGAYPLGLEPMLPALAMALACWAADLLLRRLGRPTYNPPPGTP